MGPIHDNFISWWTTHMLIKGQHNKMHKTWQIVKEAESYLLHQWRFWSVVLIRSVSEPCVCILYVWALGYGMRYSNVTASSLS